MTEPEDEDFAALFEASIKTTQFKSGQTIEGTIVAIGPEVAFVDVGAKGEATLSLDELKDDVGALTVKVGDRIQATVTSTTGGLTLSRKLQRNAASAQQVENAFRNGLAVDGKVDAAVKGGYSVTIAKLRAFCPASQIDIARETDPASHLGRVYTFKIIEFAEGGRKFVVSRRAIQEIEQRAKADDLRRNLAVDAIVTGRVVSVPEFGAFVDLGGGVQGLLHVSEMAWTRVNKASEVVAPGQEITVKVLRIDDEKIALGLKQLSADPWAVVQATYAPQQLHRGRVERVAEFGVFVELEHGIVGLVPASETGTARGTDLKKAFPVGAEVEVVVLDIDSASRKIRLSLQAVKQAEEAAEVRDFRARDADAGGASFGSLADKLRDAFKK